MNDWETDRLTGRQTGSPINTDREIDRHKQVGRHNFAGRQINRWAYIQQIYTCCLLDDIFASADMHLQGFVHFFEPLKFLAHELLHVTDGGNIMTTFESRLQLLRLRLQMPDNRGNQSRRSSDQ